MFLWNGPLSSFPFVIMSVYHARLVCHHVYLSSHNVIMSICICQIYVRLSSSVFHHVHLSQCPSVITPVCHHACLSSCPFIIMPVCHHVHLSSLNVIMSICHVRRSSCPSVITPDYHCIMFSNLFLCHVC